MAASTQVCCTFVDWLDSWHTKQRRGTSTIMLWVTVLLPFHARVLLKWRGGFTGRCVAWRKRTMERATKIKRHQTHQTITQDNQLHCHPDRQDRLCQNCTRGGTTSPIMKKTKKNELQFHRKSILLKLEVEIYAKFGSRMRIKLKHTSSKPLMTSSIDHKHSHGWLRTE